MKDRTKTCLLIMPVEFYGFMERITQELSEKGYLVTVANHEYPNGTFGKILGKSLGLFSRLATAVYLRKKYLDGRQYDLILIIKGRGLGLGVVRDMRRVAARVVGYTWDSIEFCNAPLRWQEAVSRFCTFDYRDAQSLSREVVELFGGPTGGGASPRRYRISAIMKNYDRRLEYVDRVLTTLNEKDAFVYIYEDSIFSLVINAVRSPFLCLKYRRCIHLSSLPEDAYDRILKDSDWTIDYVRDDQAGISMRCFEAAAVGTKIVSNNVYLRHSNNFDPSGYLLFRQGEGPLALIEGFSRMKGISPKPRVRTLSHFVTDLVGA